MCVVVFATGDARAQLGPSGRRSAHRFHCGAWSRILCVFSSFGLVLCRNKIIVKQCPLARRERETERNREREREGQIATVQNSHAALLVSLAIVLEDATMHVWFRPNKN